jgi:hypothetical protein
LGSLFPFCVELIFAFYHSKSVMFYVFGLCGC